MNIIGLTGGIASGKSLVASEFAKLGIDIIDTDIIAREIVEPGMPCLDKITEHFSLDILNDDGHLDRSQLRTIIFNKPEEKMWLEDLLHPEIRRIATQCADLSTSPYCIIVIPLLFEKENHYPLDAIIVVDAEPEQQLERLMQRDHLNKEDALKIIHSQVDRESRLKKADFVIRNNGKTSDLDSQINEIHRTLSTKS